MNPSTVDELYEAWEEDDFDGYPMHGIIVADKARRVYGIRVISKQAVELVVSGLKEPIAVSSSHPVFLWETYRKLSRS